jgi:deoxyribodipyrimidine photo-lyase
MNSNDKKIYGIHWFRRDLRVAGNPGLKFNWSQNKGNTLGIFCFDHQFLARPDFSTNRFQFFLETLKSLKAELQDLGGDILVLNQAPELSFESILNSLKNMNLNLPNLITWNRDYEPYALNRDQKMIKYFNSKNIITNNFRDHLIIEPHELVKNGSATDGYQVYSPYARKWMDQIKNNPEIKNRIDKKNLGFDYIEKLKAGNKEKIFNLNWSDLLKSKSLEPQNGLDLKSSSTKSNNNNNNNIFKDYLDEFIEINSKKVSVQIPKSGTLEAFKQLDMFKPETKNYGTHRDIPSLNGTSKLSMFLKNGSITTSQIISYLNLKPYENKAESGAEKYLSELVWREFYYHILFRKPEVETEAFNPKYKDLKWQNNKKWFEAWKDGKTGFPIVDAGMRELKTTGWMHNRVRMIVASFLTKDLLINWKWGEKYFMETLLDGDLAPNNGGWQWAASTGCDPQPYFRIFNPWSQGLKFDPECIYIKKFVAELKDTDPKNIHNESALRPTSYPRPIVDHSVQRNLALALYKNM